VTAGIVERSPDLGLDTRHGYCAMVIEELALAEAELLERVAHLEADLDAFRMLAQEAIHALASLTSQLDQLRRQHHHLLDECRTLRAQIRLHAVTS
jgi:hypothetical protein